jgi:hypothetical protein
MWTRVALIAALLATSRMAFALPALPAQRVEQLGRYDVLLLSEPAGEGLLRHQAIGVFDATPEQVLGVAANVDLYRSYVPGIAASKTLWQGPTEKEVVLEADLPWPLRNLWVQVRVDVDRAELGPRTHRVRFSLVRGNMLRYEGSILIEPFGEGRTAVTYEILALPDLRLPRSWLQHAAGRGARTFVHALRSRVNHLMRQGLLQPSLARVISPKD